MNGSGRGSGEFRRRSTQRDTFGLQAWSKNKLAVVEISHPVIDGKDLIYN